MVNKKAKLKVVTIKEDYKFKRIMHVAMNHIEHQFQLKLSDPDNHIPKAEKSNRKIKELFRMTYIRLPFTSLPKTLLTHMVMAIAAQIIFSSRVWIE